MKLAVSFGWFCGWARLVEACHVISIQEVLYLQCATAFVDLNDVRDSTSSPDFVL